MLDEMSTDFYNAQYRNQEDYDIRRRGEEARAAMPGQYY